MSYKINTYECKAYSTKTGSTKDLGKIKELNCSVGYVIFESSFRLRYDEIIPAFTKRKFCETMLLLDHQCCNNNIDDIVNEVIDQINNPISIVLNSGESIPVSFPENTTYVDIEIDLSDGQIDISSWMPTGLVDCTEVRFEKTDTSNNGITFTSDTGTTYNFLNIKGEVMTLKYNLINNNFKII